MEEQFLTVKQVAEKLSLSTKTIYRLVESVSIPYYRILDEIRFSPRQIEQWLEKKNSKPAYLK